MDNIIDDEWEWYIGQLFSKLIKDTNKIKVENVVEIAPGYRYKIAYALANINFKGNLYIVDINADVLKYVEKEYRRILPECKIICINKSFEKSMEYLPNEISLFLSNHCIDDMIIYEYIKDQYCINLAKNDFKEILTNAWIQLWNDKNKTDIVINKVYNSFNVFFESKKIDKIIISQYKSNLFFKENFEEMDEITKKCFNKIKSLIEMNEEKINNILKFLPYENNEYYKEEDFLNNTQNAENWIVGTFEHK